MSSPLWKAIESQKRRIRNLLHERAGRLTRETVLSPGNYGLGRIPERLQPDQMARSVCGFCATGCSLDLHLQQGEAVNLSATKEYADAVVQYFSRPAVIQMGDFKIDVFRHDVECDPPTAAAIHLFESHFKESVHFFRGGLSLEGKQTV